MAIILGLGFVHPAFGQSQNGVPGDLVVRALSFKGNHAIDRYTLEISIATSNSTWWSNHFGWLLLGEKRYFDELEFRRDVLRIQALYRLSGYLEARVDTLLRRTPRDVRIQFIITEGEPVRVTEITVAGAEPTMPARELVNGLPLQGGKPFNRFYLRASADSIRSRLQDRGFPFAEVYTGYEEDSAAYTAKVRYTVDPGRLARISAVAVLGAEKVSPRVVRRAVGVRAGQPFSRKGLYETQRNLYRTDLFTYVSVGLVDSLRTSPDDSLVAIRVQVNEGKLHVVRAGAGYGALDCFRGLAGWTGRNFFGGGRGLDLSGRLSKVGATPGILCPGLRGEDDTRRQLNYDLTLSLREPFLFTRQTSGALSFFTERHSEPRAFTRIATGGEISVTQLVTPTFPVVLTYSLSRGQTIAEPAIFCTFLNVCLENDIVFSSQQWASTLGAGVSLNRANSVFDPSHGNVLALQLRYSSPLIGSDQQRQFTKGVFEFASYEQIIPGTVFAWRIRLGALLPAQVGLQGLTQRFAPPDERLYLGGPNTVRGYTQNELGPLVRVVTGYPALKDNNDKDRKDANGVVLQDSSKNPITRTSPTGGDRLVLGNAELRFPIWGRLRGAVFVDVGEIYGGEPRALQEALHTTPGLGLRFMTPLGPIRIDVGYNPQTPAAGPLYQVEGAELKLINPTYQEPAPRFVDHLRFHFSVGQPF